MTELKAKIAQVQAAYEPGWGRDGERTFRRLLLTVAGVVVLLQIL